MDKFSQRMGMNTAVQIGSMNVGLRNSLWNVFWEQVRWGLASYYAEKFCEKIWAYCFNKLLDELPSKDVNEVMAAIKEHYFTLQWYEVYDLIEFVAHHIDEYRVDDFIAACNTTLKRELSAYRFVEKKLVPVTSEQEIAEIEEAIHISQGFTPHLEQALTSLANKQSPDYRNSVKESISAVEAMCQLITGNKKATLGDGLRQIESKLGGLHTALRNAFNSLYGYTSDAQGIRHALLGESNLDVEDTRFMLIACSAFINYLAAKADKAGIKLSNQ